MLVKLKPALKSYLWGGTKLKTEWQKRSSEEALSESWELSFHREGPSEIDSGPLTGRLLRDITTRKDWGKNCNHFASFPVLNKLIDTAFPLSIQVHPSDEYALSHEGQCGKSELWHILAAEPDSCIYLGLNTDMTEEEFRNAVMDKTIGQYLNRIPARVGDTYFIESGILHAIGEGVTVFEAQQNSSLTYRVYDFDREDKDGNKRELHIDKAAAVVNLSRYVAPNVTMGEFLGRCKYFSVYRYSGEMSLGREDTFTSLTVIDGEIDWGNLHLQKGESAFLSAGEKACVTGEGSYIVTMVEPYEA